MSLSIIDLLNHILDEALFINREKSALTEEQFMMDEKATRAFVRSLEIIGEASKNISNEFKEKHKNIEWKEMARMRDKLIHHYFGVDYCLVWNIAEENIPKLIKQIEAIMKKFDS